MEKLADHFHKTGVNLDEAEVLYQRIIRTKRADADCELSDHYSTLDSLAALSINTGKFNQAIEAQSEMLEIAETFEEEYNEDKVHVCAKLAWILDMAGRYSEAEPAFLNAIARALDTFGEWGGMTLVFKANMALCLEHQGKSEEARLLVLDTLENSKAHFGVSHPVYLRVGARAASIHFRHGRQAAAIAPSGEVLEGNRAIFGADAEETTCRRD